MLRREGANYVLPVKISQSVKKGEANRFLLRLGVPCTLQHRFRVKLRTAAGDEIESGAINFDALLPRTKLAELQVEAEAKR